MLLAAALPAEAQRRSRRSSALRYVETADGSRSTSTRNIVHWQHVRLVFSKDLDRVAVGHDSLLKVEVLSSREVLLLGRQIGRTSVLAWFQDGTNESFVFNVIEDLAVLGRALRDIHEDIRIESAPDRSAVILRGVVPDVSYKIAAESAARSYLAAGRLGTGGGLLVRSVPDAPEPTETADGADADADTLEPLEPLDLEPRLRVSPGALGGAGRIAIINLIQVEQLPLTTEQKIEEAIADIGGREVRVRRVQAGDLPDDDRDTLILEGTAPHQVALVRVLNVASGIFLGTGSPGKIAVLADEGGGVFGRRNNRRRAGLGTLGALSGIAGANSLGSLDNELSSNVGRAKLLSVAGGRILSLIEVVDVPQVRVAVKLYEINRNRLKQWRPSLAVTTSGLRSGSLRGDQGLVANPDASQRIGSDGFDVEDAFQIVNGAFTNQFQIGNSDVSLDALFSALEAEGIARNLSRPNLTVLSGEVAVFQVGGTVPVPVAFSPAFGGQTQTSVTPGVFGGVQLLPFGVQLAVRPMVGDDDTITMDVNPVIVDPDARLTEDIVATTRTPAPTTAFRRRSIETSARMQDGQALVIGGLVSHNDTDSRAKTPGLHRVPILGWFAKSTSDTDNDTELVIVVTPSIVRDQVAGIELWEYPTFFELLEASVTAPGVSPTAAGPLPMGGGR